MTSIQKRLALHTDWLQRRWTPHSTQMELVNSFSNARMLFKSRQMVSNQARIAIV
jgi:hypothetical protein